MDWAISNWPLKRLFLDSSRIRQIKKQSKYSKNLGIVRIMIAEYLT